MSSRPYGLCIFPYLGKVGRGGGQSRLCVPDSTLFTNPKGPKERVQAQSAVWAILQKVEKTIPRKELS